MPVQLTCINCQKVFETKPYRAHIPYCGKDCRKEYLGKRVTLKCAHCGGPWETWVSQLKDANRQFCSMNCRRTAMAAKPKPEKLARAPVIKRCLTCDIVFRVPPSREGSAKFCSHACAGANREFRNSLSKAQRGERSPRFLRDGSITDKGYAKVRSWHGDNPMSTFKHREVLLLALVEADRDHPFLFEVDGVKVLRPEIHVHHIDRNKLNNSLSNLLAVTASAHALIHRNGRKPDPWECWPPNPTNW